MIISVPNNQIEPLMKRMFFLAWKACGGPEGMGWLQDRGPIESEESVWNNIQNSGDYPGRNSHLINKDPTRIHADYVFGRMMKMLLIYKDDQLSFYDNELSPDYESWCTKYPSYEDLAKAAAAELGIEVKFIQEVEA